MISDDKSKYGIGDLPRLGGMIAANASRNGLRDLVYGAVSAPMTIEGQWFHNKQVALDGYRFVKCRFDSCTLVTSKGTFELKNCVVSETEFAYTDEALKIVKLFALGSPEMISDWPALSPKLEADGTYSIVGQ